MTEALEREYSIEEEIGRGRFGVVFRCTSRSSGDSFALKSVDKRALTDPLDATCLLSEPRALTHLPPHPFIVGLYDLFEDDRSLYIVMGLCAGGDLHSLIASVGPLSEATARPIFSQVMHAVSHCHRFGVVHRDIKAENVLFDSCGTAKVADFGSADFVDEDDSTLYSVVGTPFYVAPEILRGSEYGKKVDVWSAGVLLYVMLSGFYPFCGQTAGDIFEAVLMRNVRFSSGAFCTVSSQAKDLIRKMLCKDPYRRISADQVLQHEWVNGG